MKTDKNPLMKSDDEDEDDKEDKNPMAKSALVEEDLRKSMDMIEQVMAKSTKNRQAELMEKVSKGQASAEERAELAKSLMPATDESPLNTEVRKSLQQPENENFQKSIDATDFLEGIHTGVVEAVAKLATSIEKSMASTQETDFVLAKGLHDVMRVQMAQGELVKSLVQALKDWGAAPARAPKSTAAAGAVDVVKKGFADGPEGAETLSKSQALQALSGMIQKAGAANQIEFADQLISAATQLEVTGNLDPVLLPHIQEFLRNGK